MAIPFTAQFAAAAATADPGRAALSLLLYFGFVVVPACLLGWLISFLLSLPMRRQERARFFIHLVEMTLREGKPLERTLVDISNSHDTSLGVRFHLFATYLEQGLTFSEALKKVPRFLPPQITAMLRAGEELGDLKKVLPACRYLLNDAQSSVRGAASYLVILAFVLSPVAIFVLTAISLFVFPKIGEIIAGMDGTPPHIFLFVRDHLAWLVAAESALFAGIVVSAVLYIGGPRLVRWFNFKSVPVVDWIAWRVPWKHKRMQRNFSAMLAALLDGGVPENVAVRLAGDCAANTIFSRRALLMERELANGATLSRAVQPVDDTGEFGWRLVNAARAHGGFLATLAGWHEALDAKAFQQEQAAAHVLTSAMVLANGALVLLVALSVFGTLISLIETGVLW